MNSRARLNQSVLNCDFFALLGVEPVFDLDEAELLAAYRRVQAEVHPDRHVCHAENERRLALQVSVRVNEAWQTLKNPVSRARYLLQKLGVDTAEESNTAMPSDFLMMQMEWREAVAEARAARDSAHLEKMLVDVRRDQNEMLSDLSAAFRERDAPDTAAAALLVRKLRFLDKLEQEMGDALESLLF